MANSTLDLHGRRVVMTRAEQQAAALSHELQRRGATPLSLPTLQLRPATDCGPLDAALGSLESFDWVLFTSQNAVVACEQWLARSGRSWRMLAPTRRLPRVAVVGTATQGAAEAVGLKVAHTSQAQLGEALAEELADAMPGARVLVPRSDLADSRLPQALSRSGATVTAVTAYSTCCAVDWTSSAAQELLAGRTDAIAFFSPSAVRSLLQDPRGAGLRARPPEFKIAAIGKVTAAELELSGMPADVIAARASVVGLVDALADCFRRGREQETHD